jgi:hypothetical protein
VSSLSAAAEQPTERSGVLDFIPSTIDWMFHLQSSDLFLRVWKKQARDVLVGRIPGGTELLHQVERLDHHHHHSNLKGKDDDGKDDEETQLLEEIKQNVALPREIQGNQEETHKFYTTKLQEVIADRDQKIREAAVELDAKISKTVFISYTSSSILLLLLLLLVLLLLIIIIIMLTHVYSLSPPPFSLYHRSLFSSPSLANILHDQIFQFHEMESIVVPQVKQVWSSLAHKTQSGELTIREYDVNQLGELSSQQVYIVYLFLIISFYHFLILFCIILQWYDFVLHV